MDMSTSLSQSVLQKTIDYEHCQIDPAPFQLVERTSLYKVLIYILHLLLVNTVDPLLSNPLGE